ncbi:hypothetical protein GCM10010517_63360 [Streptosporangium fragile]|uniref:Phenyloxazoline synthase MbtB n=1 Tax=Streptosporangium fragile TaxID=46186 RepID=A0ABN3W7E3_9ACTN
MSDENPMPAGAVAVVGMALRVPGARTPEDFWRNLRGGVESIKTFTEEELLADGAAPEEIAHPDYVPAFGALDDMAGFDARFFGLSPREAQMLDPQHRLFLECAWEALEHAGHPSDATEAVTGVYAGVGENSYFLNNLLPNGDLVARVGAFQTSIGNDKDFVPTRVSYKLNLRGPSVSVQTGCSTSLVAVHLACQALISGECDIALAGGATVVARPRGYRFEQGGIMSPDGHCRAFDEGAAGTVPGSGVGVVVLKRLADAVADGDVIHAVVRGSAVNNDGARKVGFTAPSVEGQADVITEALAVAEVDPSTVSYVEAHGTGTPLGDPIEVAALKSVFGGAGSHRCALGSVKTNIGHLDTAAGVVGMIKTILALKAREIPPSLHVTRPHPRLGLEDGPFHVNTSLTPWRGDVLRAGVSSFGIGGTNAHVVLEEAPERAAAAPGRRTHVLPVSAATPTALETAAAELAAYLRAHPDERLDDVAYTLQRGRWTLPHRRFVVARSLAEAAGALSGPAQTGCTGHETAKDREVVFAFPGQGAQRIRMGQALYEREPVFRAEIDRAAGILEPALGTDIRRLLHPPEAERDAAREAVNRTEYAQPALFAVEYALARLWMSWGVRPAAMIGHSLGELVAACLADVLAPEDALRLVAARGRLMRAAPAGAMAAVPLPEAELVPLLGGELALAAVNGPRECVVSGPFDALTAFEADLAERGIASKRLRTSHAFHSPMMDGAAAAFEAEVARVRLAPPQIPFVSNVTGTWITEEEAVSPAYWARQIRSAVRFGDGLRTVRRPGALLLEVGPGRVLTGLARAGDGLGAVASLPSAAEDGDAEREVLTAAGELWCRGVSVAWEALHGGTEPRRTVLPTYPFERERFWVDPPRGAVALRGAHRRPVPATAPDGPAATDRHSGARYTLVGDGPLAAVFGRSLSRAGATVRDLSTVEPSAVEAAAEAAAKAAEAGTPGAPGTVLVLLDVRTPAVRAVETLARAVALVDGAPSGAVSACEIHVAGGDGTDVSHSPLAVLVESHTALLRRESGIPWTSVVWSRGEHVAVERAAVRVVGAEPGACHVVVTPAEESGDRSAVPAPGGTAGEEAPLYEDATEHQVAAVFSDLLGVERIAPTTGFFELGGHSLLAAQLVAQVRKVCGVEIPLRAFVDEPTIRGLARAVRTARSAAADAPPEELPVIVPDPGSSDEPFPLTDVQQAYWIGRTGVFEIGNVGMHGYEEFDVPDLDLPRMERAFRRLVQRHGMLRAIVLPHGEQRILKDVPDYVIATKDVRGLPRDEADAVLERTRAAMSHQVFAPDRWPLFELRATVMDGGRTRLHYSIDGLITDAWASHILMRELAHLYRYPDTPLPEIDLSFRDYVLAERSLETTDRYRRAEAYWQERIPDLALAPELPLARDPRAIDAPRFRRWTGELPEEPWTRVKSWASRRGITPTALLLTVYGEALATWSKNRRFTLNLPMANRLPLHPQVDAIVGDFTSVTLLEIDAVSEAPFEARAAAVRDRLLTDLDHRLFSGVRVMREMKKIRGEAAAVMPAVFTSLFTAYADHTPIGEVAYSISQTPQVWIDAQVYEVDGALMLDIDAVEELFPEGVVSAIHAATMELLRWLAEDEAHWGRPVPSLVPRAELAARQEYNRTEGPLPSGLLHTPFFDAAARTPGRPAVITPGLTMSYGELAARARGIAARLGDLDVRPNDLVAVVMEKGWEQCAAVLGILAAGAAYLPVDPELPDERIRFLLEHGRARAVLTQARVADAGQDRFSGFSGAGTVLRVDELPAGGLSDTAPSPDVSTTPDDLAYVIFTSGSTGLPKGVMIDHRGALNTVADVNERFGVSEDDRVLALSSLSFDLSVYDVFGPLAVGGAVVVPDAATQRDPAAWLDLMERARVTVWNSVPALMELLVEHMSVKEATGTALRLVMLSGDWIPVTLPPRIRRVLGAPDVISLGGATEASIWSILHPIGDVPADWTSIPYGRPMRNQTFHVLDDALRPRPTGVPGQLYIGGVGLARGYLRDEAKTAASFIVHPETGERLYRTGDLGRFLPGGDIEFLGREDFQVKVQGYRIELGEIEAALTQHPDVRAAVVVVQGEPRGAKRLVAFVVPQEGHGLPQDLRTFLGAKLPEYMVPGVYLEIGELPLTANGKVDRRALVVPEDVAGEDAPPYEAPRTALEKAVAEVWSSMLQVEHVGVHDNFFALGGDSLMAMRAVVHLRKVLGIEVPIRVLFDSPTLEDTALVIEDLLLTEIEGMSDEEAQTLLSD